MDQTVGNTGGMEEPALLGTIQVDYYDNGTTRVRNFPADVYTALDIMTNAVKTLGMFLVKLSLSGGIANGQEQSRILRPDVKIDPAILRSLKGGGRGKS